MENLGKIKGKGKVYNMYHYKEYNKLSDAKKNKLDQEFKPINLKLKDYDYGGWFTEEELDDEEKLDELPPLEGNEEEIKEGKGLKILTPNKLLIRFPTLLAQIKAGSNSYKLKIEIRQIQYPLYQHNKITKNVYNKLIKSLQ